MCSRRIVPCGQGWNILRLHAQGAGSQAPRTARVSRSPIVGRTISLRAVRLSSYFLFGQIGIQQRRSLGLRAAIMCP